MAEQKSNRAKRYIDESQLLPLVLHKKATPYGWVAASYYRCQDQCPEDHLYSAFPVANS